MDPKTGLIKTWGIIPRSQLLSSLFRKNNEIDRKKKTLPWEGRGQ
jgi:hypothetical protein